MTVEILRIYEDHVTATFTIINVREWLAASGGTKFSKPIEEMSKEELMNVGLAFLLVLVRYLPSRNKRGLMEN